MQFPLEQPCSQSSLGTDEVSDNEGRVVSYGNQHDQCRFQMAQALARDSCARDALEVSS